MPETPSDVLEAIELLNRFTVANPSGPHPLGWAVRVAHGIDEAYRVMREPASHGGTIGWQVTVWREGAQWRREVAMLDFFTASPAPAPGDGVAMSGPDVDRVLCSVERSAFWDETPRPERMGLDGYQVFFEGWRSGRSLERSAWCPSDEMFTAFAAMVPRPRESRSSCIGCVLVLALVAPRSDMRSMR